MSNFYIFIILFLFWATKDASFMNGLLYWRFELRACARHVWQHWYNIKGTTQTSDARRNNSHDSASLYQAAPCPNEVDCKVHETLAFQKWTRRKSAKRNNLYIENTRGIFLKNIINYNCY